jgi:hypothetical protein
MKGVVLRAGRLSVEKRRSSLKSAIQIRNPDAAGRRPSIIAADERRSSYGRSLLTDEMVVYTINYERR